MFKAVAVATITSFLAVACAVPNEPWEQVSILADDTALLIDTSTIQVEDNILTVDLWARQFSEKARFKVTCGCNGDGNEQREQIAVARVGTNKWRNVQKEPNTDSVICHEIAKVDKEVEMALLAYNIGCTADNIRQLYDK